MYERALHVAVSRLKEGSESIFWKRDGAYSVAASPAVTSAAVAATIPTVAVVSAIGGVLMLGRGEVSVIRHARIAALGAGLLAAAPLAESPGDGADEKDQADDQQKRHGARAKALRAKREVQRGRAGDEFAVACVNPRQGMAGDGTKMCDVFIPPAVAPTRPADNARIAATAIPH
jgi:hypothetical protein